LSSNSPTYGYTLPRIQIVAETERSGRERASGLVAISHGKRKSSKTLPEMRERNLLKMTKICCWQQLQLPSQRRKGARKRSLITPSPIKFANATRKARINRRV
jgi:hypothetical protein